MSWHWSFDHGTTCEYVNFLGVSQVKCSPTWVVVVALAVAVLGVAYQAWQAWRGR